MAEELELDREDTPASGDVVQARERERSVMAGTGALAVGLSCLFGF